MNNNSEFDRIFDECLERVLTSGESIEQCLSRYPEQAAELAPLLQTALSARRIMEISPRPEFRERARYQMRAEIRSMAEKEQRRFSLFHWQPRWATAVVAVLVLVLASSGTVATASNTMPDQTLYPVKLATETVRLALTPSKLGKAEYYAELVDKRVNEIVNLAEKGQLQQMEETTERMNDQLMAVAVLLGSETASTGMAEVEVAPTPEVVIEATEPAEVAETPEAPAMMMAPASEAVLRQSPAEEGEPQNEQPEITIGPAAPEKEMAPAMAPASAAAPEPDKAVEKAGEEEKGQEGKGDRKARLKEILTENARKHPEALRAALQRVPEQARPALLRALQDSNTEYEKLLEFLKEMGEDEGWAGEREDGEHEDRDRD